MKPRKLLNEADRCVKCGLCLPHCPTYRLTKDEGDSPRGRISLVQALLEGGIDTPALHAHLDRCLGCLKCEAACPSGVRYGQLIDGTRALQQQYSTIPKRLTYWAISHLPYIAGAKSLVGFYQRSNLRRLLRGVSEKFRHLDGLLPETAIPSGTLHPYYAAKGESLGQVGLFTGCVGRITDHSALLASIRVLTALGFEVVVPQGQGCCGAVHQHNGQPREAARMADVNQRSFNNLGLQAIVYVASGCGIQLESYPHYNEALDAEVLEICNFVARSGLLARDHLRPLSQRAVIHTPCTQLRSAGKASGALSLLELIPELVVETLSSSGCCGAAGSYLLYQTKVASALRQDVLQPVLHTGADLLLTSNTGCTLHLSAGLRDKGNPLRVRHPIEVVAEQLWLEGTGVPPSGVGSHDRLS